MRVLLFFVFLLTGCHLHCDQICKASGYEHGHASSVSECTCAVTAKASELMAGKKHCK
jgi:hypothetical protein